MNVNVYLFLPIYEKNSSNYGKAVPNWVWFSSINSFIQSFHEKSFALNILIK